MKHKRNLTLYFVISSLILFLFSFSIFYIFEIEMNNIKFEEVKENEEELVDFQNQLLGKRFRTVLGDIHYLHHVYDEKLSHSENIEEVAKDWTEFSEQRQLYDQIRFIDSSGDEVIRVNFDGDKASLVEDSMLQNKKDRYYFSETKKLSRESVFVSPLDLNMENGEIEEPYKPMIRFSIPSFNQMGEFQGIIILNYLGNTILDDFKNMATNSDGIITLLNSDSYWLSCEDADNEWNFMFEDKKDEMFSKYYPDEWNKIIKEKEKGQILTENGLFTYAPVHLNHDYTKDDEYQIDENIQYYNSIWHIVSIIDNDNPFAPYFIDNPLVTIRKIFKNNSFTLWLILIVSIIMGYLVYLNRKKYYKIKFYSEYDPLTEALNRRAGYREIQKKIDKNDRRKVALSLCFIDVNGLKQVNDNLGHDSGDELLTTVSEIVQANIRESDFLIRQGGDEFIIVFNGIGFDKSEKIWGRIVSKFEEMNESNNYPYLISVSHGMVEYTSNDDFSVDDLIQLADDKMYEEKEMMKRDFHVLKEAECS